MKLVQRAAASSGRLGFLCLTAALAGCGSPAQGVSLDPPSGPGSWASVQSLPTARFEGYAATAGGRIYFLGGIADHCADGSSACASDRVDVYDPATGDWTPAAPLPAAAPRHHPVPERFVRWVAARLGAPDPAAIAAACSADLNLALACAEGDRRALGDFEATLDAIRLAIATLGAGPADVEEVLQRLRVQMLVGDRPGISAYGGRGELRAWLRVVAVREAVRVLAERGRSQTIDDTRLLEAMLPEIDAEREVIGSELRAVFRAAFEEAIRSLAPRDRLVLRQHGVDDLSIDQIGAVHGVHRATAARWIERARVELAVATERALQRRLGSTPDEVRSLMRLIASRMDASVHRLLAD